MIQFSSKATKGVKKTNEQVDRISSRKGNFQIKSSVGFVVLRLLENDIATHFMGRRRVCIFLFIYTKAG
jgi:hypothetical protein